MKTMQQFTLKQILNITTHLQLTNFDDIREILNWMTNEKLEDYHLPSACLTCEKYLFDWFPDLKDASKYVVECLQDAICQTEEAADAILDGACEIIVANYDCTNVYNVPQIPAGVFKKLSQEECTRQIVNGMLGNMLGSLMQHLTVRVIPLPEGTTIDDLLKRLEKDTDDCDD